VIIDAVAFGMIDLAEFRRLRRIASFDFWVAMAAVVGVLSVGVLAGVAVGIALSLLWLVRVATSPAMPLLGSEGGVVTLRLDGGLFFATSQALEDRVRELLADGSADAVVLDLESVNYIDSQGAAQLAAIADLVEAAGATLRLDRVKPGVREVLRADGLAERLPIAGWLPV
jgi:anti-anti-sigma factor